MNDALAYLKDFANKDQIEQLYKVSKGIPSRLSSFARTLQAGTEVDTLIEQLPELLDPEFDIEWQVLAFDDENQTLAVAVPAHDRNTHSINTLSSLLAIGSQDLRKKMLLLTFIELPESDDAHLRFVSEAFRGFAEKRLSQLRARILNLVIEGLEREPHTDNALTLLPKYLLEANQPERLLSYLTPEHFANVLNRTGSVAPIIEQTNLGAKTAASIRQDRQLLRLAIQGSSVTGLNGIRISIAEIKARASIGDFDSAVALDRLPFLRLTNYSYYLQFVLPEKDRDWSPRRSLGSDRRFAKTGYGRGFG